MCNTGANIAITVWGRKENAWIFLIPELVLDKHGLLPQEKPAKTGFDLGMNPDALRKEMTEMGFTNIKMWYQPMNFNYQSFDEYFNFQFA